MCRCPCHPDRRLRQTDNYGYQAPGQRCQLAARYRNRIRVGCLRCFDGTTGHAAENQDADKARLLQTRRCRKSLGRIRRTAWALSVYNDGASQWGPVNNQNVDDQTEGAGARSMNPSSKDKTLSGDSPRLTAEQRLKQLGLKLPAPPEPLGIYAEAVKTGNLLFLTGMLPTVGREAKFIGRIGAELDVQTGRKAAYLAALNALAVARQHLGSLDKVTRIVRLGVLVATSGDVREQPKIADSASELLQDVFGKDKNPSRLVYGVASLPLGVPVELELIFEVTA